MKKTNSSTKNPIKDLLIQKEEEKKKNTKNDSCAQRESAFFFSSHPTMNQLEGTSHKLFMQPQKPTVLVVPKQGVFPESSNSNVKDSSKTQSLLMLTDGSERIEMYCPNPMCRKMQYYHPKGKKIATTFGVKQLTPHQCAYCWGKQDFVENSFRPDDWHDDDDRGGETLTTKRAFDLEMFPSRDGFSKDELTNQWFEEGKQIEASELNELRNGDSMYPQHWERLQNHIKEYGKKAAQKVKQRIKKNILEETEKNGIFAPSDLTIKLLKYQKAGNPFLDEVFDPLGKIDKEGNYIMGTEDGLPIMWKYWEESNKTCRPNCSGIGHICHKEMKFVFDNAEFGIPAKWWEERNLAVKNADAKREREGKPIEEKTKFWIDIYVKKLGITNIDTSKLKENDARKLSWDLNVTGRQNVAKKSGKPFDKTLLEKAIRKLIDLCGLTD